MGFIHLRDRVPHSTSTKKLSKVETLREAVRYIQHLQEILNNDSEKPFEPIIPSGLQSPVTGAYESDSQTQSEPCTSQENYYMGCADQMELAECQSYQNIHLDDDYSVHNAPTYHLTHQQGVYYHHYSNLHSNPHSNSTSPYYGNAFTRNFNQFGYGQFKSEMLPSPSPNSSYGSSSASSDGSNSLEEQQQRFHMKQFVM
ncbi:unnamed protein product [Anisakis simplex]|uniref:BHLH domain-containing protein n=1 Tax=Anisakis simplex TaxID=6269 RepID=A0A0M3J4Q7_ANISI|nr:unnamed protein product [Anisakis simplex]